MSNNGGYLVKRSKSYNYRQRGSKRRKDERNWVHMELWENYGGKSVPHKDKTKYRRKQKHREDYAKDDSNY